MKHSPHMMHYHDFAGTCIEPNAPKERATIPMVVPLRKLCTPREVIRLAVEACSEENIEPGQLTVEEAIDILQGSGQYSFASWRL